MSLIDTAIYRSLVKQAGFNIKLRLFTKSPFEEDYVQNVTHNKFARNAPFWLWRRLNYTIVYDYCKDFVEEYYRHQTCILIYNNPKASKTDLLETLQYINNWNIDDFSEENVTNYVPVDNFNTLVDWAKSLTTEKLIDYMQYSFEDKTNWYSDKVEFLSRKDDMSYGEWKAARKELKLNLRTDSKQSSDKDVIIQTSLDYQQEYNGLIPTIKILSEEADTNERRVKQLTVEDIHWQVHSKYKAQLLQLVYNENPHITLQELSNTTNIPLRTIKRYVKVKQVKK